MLHALWLSGALACSNTASDGTGAGEAAAPATGGTGGAHIPQTATPPVEGAFDATVIIESITPTPAPPWRSPPDRLAFSLHIDGKAGQRRIVVSQRHAAATGTANETASNTLLATAPLGIPSIGICEGLAGVTYSRLELWKNQAGNVEGLAEGTLIVARDDVGMTFAFKGRVETRPDRTAPELYLNRHTLGYGADRRSLMDLPNPTQVHPFDDVVIAASESLRPLTRVYLVVDGAEEIDLAPERGAEDTFRSYSLAWTHLRPNRQYEVRFSPGAVDRAGNAAANTISFRTSDVPSYAKEDFEGDRPRSLHRCELTPSANNVEVSLPPISGASSLLIPPAEAREDQMFAMRLPLPMGSQRVTMKIRTVGETPNYLFSRPQIAIFSRAGKFSEYVWPPVGPATSPTPTQGTALGEITDVSLPLPEGASGEVMLRIAGFRQRLCGPAPRRHGLLVDDIVVD